MFVPPHANWYSWTVCFKSSAINSNEDLFGGCRDVTCVQTDDTPVLVCSHSCLHLQRGICYKCGSRVCNWNVGQIYHTTRLRISDKINLHGHCCSNETLYMNWICEGLEGETNCLTEWIVSDLISRNVNVKQIRYFLNINLKPIHFEGVRIPSLSRWNILVR